MVKEVVECVRQNVPDQQKVIQTSQEATLFTWYGTDTVRLGSEQDTPFISLGISSTLHVCLAGFFLGSIQVVLLRVRMLWSCGQKQPKCGYRNAQRVRAPVVVVSKAVKPGQRIRNVSFLHMDIASVARQLEGNLPSH